jgi:F-type H+-transporting ATPase subunit b
MFGDPFFWVVVAFIGFIAAVFKPVSKIVAGGLDGRAAKIQKDLDEALRLKEEAQALLASYQRKQREAADEAKSILQFAEEEAKRIRESSEQELEEALNKRTEIAMQKISAYETAVLQGVKKNAVDIALGAVRSLIVENLNKDHSEELVRQAMNDMQRKLN